MFTTILTHYRNHCGNLEVLRLILKHFSPEHYAPFALEMAVLIKQVGDKRGLAVGVVLLLSRHDGSVRAATVGVWCGFESAESAADVCAVPATGAARSSVGARRLSMETAFGSLRCGDCFCLKLRLFCSGLVDRTLSPFTYVVRLFTTIPPRPPPRDM